MRSGRNEREWSHSLVVQRASSTCFGVPGAREHQGKKNCLLAGAPLPLIDLFRAKIPANPCWISPYYSIQSFFFQHFELYERFEIWDSKTNRPIPFRLFSASNLTHTVSFFFLNDLYFVQKHLLIRTLQAKQSGNQLEVDRMLTEVRQTRKKRVKKQKLNDMNVSSSPIHSPSYTIPDDCYYKRHQAPYQWVNFSLIITKTIPTK